MFSVLDLEDRDLARQVFNALNELSSRIGMGDLSLGDLDDYNKHILFTLLDVWGQFE